jgi:hypothetical protein
VRDEGPIRFYRPCRDGHFFLHHFPALRTGLLSSGPFGTDFHQPPVQSIAPLKLTRMGVCRTICQLHMRRCTSQSDIDTGSHADSAGKLPSRFAPFNDDRSQLQKRQQRRTTEIVPRASTTNPVNTRIATAISAIPICVLSTVKDSDQSNSTASMVSANAMSRSLIRSLDRCVRHSFGVGRAEIRLPFCMG